MINNQEPEEIEEVSSPNVALCMPRIRIFWKAPQDDSKNYSSCQSNEPTKLLLPKNYSTLIWESDTSSAELLLL